MLVLCWVFLWFCFVCDSISLNSSQHETTRLASASDKVYLLLAHGRWFSPGTPASSTTETGPHDIAERGVKHKKIKSSKPLILNLYKILPDLILVYNVKHIQTVTTYFENR